jgi:hypothetical protein
VSQRNASGAIGDMALLMNAVSPRVPFILPEVSSFIYRLSAILLMKMNIVWKIRIPYVRRRVLALLIPGNK